MPREQRGIFEYLRLEDERPFLLKAFEQKLNDEGRLAYADLVEKRDPERAEWLRLEVQLHTRATDDPAVHERYRALSRELGHDYIHFLRRDMILNCGSAEAKQEPLRVRFAYACPKRWETLTPTEAESVRFCQACKERVYHCDTVAEAATHALAGHCIAVPQNLSGGGVNLDTSRYVGRPDPVGDWARQLFSNEDE